MEKYLKLSVVLIIFILMGIGFREFCVPLVGMLELNSVSEKAEYDLEERLRLGDIYRIGKFVPVDVDEACRLYLQCGEVGFDRIEGMK